MTPAKADTEKIPIEKVDSATRAPEPLEKAAAERAAADARLAGSNPGLPFLPPGDVPGQVMDPNFPSPPPFFNIYSFTVFFKSPIANDPSLPADSAAQPSLRLGLAASFAGKNVRIAAPNVQAAFQALMASTDAPNILKVIGPCASFVGADATLSSAAEVVPVTGGMQAKPLHSDTGKKPAEKDSQTTPRKSHTGWD